LISEVVGHQIINRQSWVLDTFFKNQCHIAQYFFSSWFEIYKLQVLIAMLTNNFLRAFYFIYPSHGGFLLKILSFVKSYLGDHAELECWTDNVSYSLNNKRRWQLPARLQQLVDQQLEQLQEEPYDLLVQTTQDPQLYTENRDVQPATKFFYQSKAEQAIFRGESCLKRDSLTRFSNIFTKQLLLVPPNDSPLSRTTPRCLRHQRFVKFDKQVIHGVHRMSTYQVIKINIIIHLFR